MASAVRRSFSHSTRENKKISSAGFETEFIGSFFSLDQLPRDRWPRIAVAGRSNVGKSSLLNRLLGQKKLAKVSSTPGKTRSLNFFAINQRFYLVDLPGYGYAKVSRSVKNSWGKLVQSYLAKDIELIGLLLLLDCRRELTDEDRQMLDWLSRRETPVMLVLTKTDKISRGAAKQKVAALEKELGTSAISFSSVTGEGRRELTRAMFDLLESGSDNRKANVNG